MRRTINRHACKQFLTAATSPIVAATAALGLTQLVIAQENVPEQAQGLIIRSLDLRFSEELERPLPEVGAETPEGPVQRAIPGEVQTRVSGGGTDGEQGARVDGFTASVSTRVKADDNVRRQATKGPGDISLILAPAFELRGSFGKQQLSIGYDGTYSSFTDLNAENTVSHQLRGESVWRYSKRLRGKIEASYAVSYENREDPTGRLANNVAPDQFFERTVRAETTYGRRIAKAEIQSTLEHQSLRYQNNGQQGRDLDIYSIGLKGYYNATPKLSAVAELRRQYYDYRVNSPLDGERITALLGVRWEATAKTSGEFKVGRQQRSYDDPTVSLGSIGNAWEGSLLWEPRSYSKVLLGWVQQSEEASLGGAGGTLTTRNYTMNWSHGFSEFLRMDNEVTFTRNNFGTRKDTQLKLAARLSYQINDLFDIGAEFTRTVRESTDVTAEFEDNIIMFEFNARYPGQ